MPDRHPELARSLLQRAGEDAYAVRMGVHDPEFPDWILGFHAQQAVEKALKAVLSAGNIEYPRTHNLQFLVDLLDGHGIATPPRADQLARLTPFGATLRYDPTPLADTPPLDRNWAHACVQDVLAWAGTLVA